MKLFAPPKRKRLELLIMLFLSGIFFIFYPKAEGVILFIFGFIWNWCASINLDPMYENRRYRFSMLCTVRNTQKLFLKPFRRTPALLQRFIRVLPAGVFWWMVIYINQSDMPWWATFIGSLCYELVQIEMKLFKAYKRRA